MRADARAHRGAVLRLGREAPPERDRGQAGHAAPLGSPCSTSRLQADQERGRRDLALRRERRLLGRDREQPGTNFLRGGQRTNASGVATFETIYPGWYPGRAVHIHVKVHVGGNVVHTGQLFFPAASPNAVYRKAPYSRTAASRHAERERRDLPQRRGEGDARARAKGRRLHRVDSHGGARLRTSRVPAAMKIAVCVSRSRTPVEADRPVDEASRPLGRRRAQPLRRERGRGGAAPQGGGRRRRGSARHDGPAVRGRRDAQGARDGRRPGDPRQRRRCRRLGRTGDEPCARRRARARVARPRPVRPIRGRLRGRSAGAAVADGCAGRWCRRSPS